MINRVLLTIIISLALSAAQNLRQEDLNGYQVTIYTQDSNTFIKALSLDTGGIFGPTQIYQGFSNSAILANINNTMAFNGTKGTSVLLIPPMYDQTVQLKSLDQSSEQKQINLLQLQIQNLKDYTSRLEKKIEDLNVIQNANIVELNTTRNDLNGLSTSYDQMNQDIKSPTIAYQAVFVYGPLAVCPESYQPVSCSCGSACGSYGIEFSDNQCHCQCGEWTEAHCIKIII